MLAANAGPSIGLVSRLSVQPSELTAIVASGGRLAMWGSLIGLAIINFVADPLLAAGVGIFAAIKYDKEARKFRALKDQLLTDHDIFEVTTYLFGDKRRRPQAPAIVMFSSINSRQI